MKNEQEAKCAIEKYSDMIRRICFLHLKNNQDVEDVFQVVFSKYVCSDTKFKSDSCEKAWFIRITINSCKGTMKYFLKKNMISFDELLMDPRMIPDNSQDVIWAVLKLPREYRCAIYLHYFEGYSAVEIAKMLRKSVKAVCTMLGCV
jgi:RNA polymerase sigma-70 factor (ECF subfamily)